MDGGRVQSSQPSEQSMYGKLVHKVQEILRSLIMVSFLWGFLGWKVQSVKTFERTVSFPFVKQIHTSLRSESTAVEWQQSEGRLERKGKGNKATKAQVPLHQTQLHSMPKSGSISILFLQYSRLSTKAQIPFNFSKSFVDFI